MINDEIKASLFAARDFEYRDFHAKLIPDICKERIIGVRTPMLRKMAKSFSKESDIEQFLNALPHEYYDEYNLHGFIISEMPDYDRALEYTNAFLPYVDNWATCDLLSPRSFRKHTNELICEIDRWLASDKVYTVRFGIDMLITHYLDAKFDPSHLAKVASAACDEYYVNMAVAWYFATALAKQWDSTISYIEEKKLPGWTHNKVIRKAIESYRVTAEHKKYLRTLMIFNGRKENE